MFSFIQSFTIRHFPLAALLASSTPLPIVSLPILGDPADIASALVSKFPNPSIALVAPPLWWWQSGSVIDGLLTYSHVTGSTTYNDLLSNTLLSQATGTDDFMTPDATGNDDQAWWSLSALTAAENRLPAPGVPWVDLARNVFNEQKGRWDTARCNGGMKWKIRDGDDGYHYKSSIANGLFFQLAARLGRFAGDGDALAWAEKSYSWTEGVGLISGNFDVFDGTDDAKGENGCPDVNHDMWSYNVGVFLYGSAVMADATGAEIWKKRTRGFLAAANRNFFKDGRLFEAKCDADGSCNTDQVSFKATLARWLGATAIILPELRQEIADIMGPAANAQMGGWAPDLDIMGQFTALEIVDASIAIGDGALGKPGVARRSVAGRVWL